MPGGICSGGNSVGLFGGISGSPLFNSAPICGNLHKGARLLITIIWWPNFRSAEYGEQTVDLITLSLLTDGRLRIEDLECRVILYAWAQSNNFVMCDGCHRAI
jgi:hypothetical protein